MKILQDHQTFIRQRFGGIARYHYELDKGLKNLGEDSSIFALLPQCEYLKGEKRMFKFHNKMLRNAVLILNDICTIIYICIKSFSKKSIDVVHVTWYKTNYVKALNCFLRKKRPKVIVTIHDLIHEMVQETDPIMKKGVKDRQKALSIADGIICVSENTKRDLLAFYPNIATIPIKVIHECASCNSNDIKTIELQKKFFLFVGNRSGYKNFVNFARGISEIVKKFDYIIFCAGGGPFNSDEKELIRKLDIGDRIIQKNVSDNELVYLYKHAECFIFPSLYEGFGIPILEAFQCRCPVLLHEGSCFQEIGGDAVMYFDGKDTDSILSAIQKIISDNKLRKKLIDKGEVRLKEFSSEKMAKETLLFYNEVMHTEG